MKTVAGTICFALLCTIVFCAGCMLGPDYKRPEFVVEPDADFENVPDNWPDPNVTDTVGPWWQTFNDPILDDLVTTALENNNDLKSAAARVLESQALLDQSHGIWFPQVAYSADRTRAKTVFNLGGDTIGTLATSYSHGLSINYMVDFFGKLKRAERAALDDFLAATENQNALVHSIIAQVVASRVQIDTRQQLLDIANANIESWKKTLNIIETRYSRGLVTSLDVHLAREKLASAQATALQLHQSVILASHGLDVLLGKRPATSEPLPDSLPDMPDLQPIPAGLPAWLLDRRPDVKSAELRLAGATERIGVSIAEMFPDLTLTATGGYRSDTFRELTNSENQVYSAIIGVAAPIFTGGSLEAGVDAARARAAQATADYAGTILRAFREVEDALVKEQLLTQRIKHLKTSFDEAVRAEELAKDRYSRGLEKVLIVLDTERTRRIAENEYVLTKAELFNTRIDLFLALGGDWSLRQYPQPQAYSLSDDNNDDPGVNDG